MLKIKLADYTADLDEASISIVMTSPFPLMATGVEGGNYIYNFSLPATPALKKIFKHSHRPAAMAGYVEVPFTVDAEGIKYSGIATLTEAGDDIYEVMCPVGNGSFNMKAKEVKLPELYLGGDISLPKLPFVAAMADNINFNAVQNGAFTISNELSFLTAISNTAELSADGKIYTAAENKNVSIKLMLNSVFPGGFPTVGLFKNGTKVVDWHISTNTQIFSHNLSLLADDEISLLLSIASLGGQLGGNIHFISGAVFAGSRLTIANTITQSTMLEGATMRYPDVNFAVFPVENPRVFDAWPDDLFSVDNVSIKVMYSEYFKVINYWHGGQFPALQEVTLNDETFTAGNLFVPFPYVAYIVNRIANYFGYRIEDNVFDDELKYAVLLNFFIENSFLTSNPEVLSFNESFNLKDHVPDWSVYEFIQHLCNLFGMGYEVNDEMHTIKFTFVEDLLDTAASDYIDISHLIVSKPHTDWNNRITAFKLLQNYPDSDTLKDDIKKLDGLTFKGAVPLLSSLPESGNVVNDCYYVIYSYAYYAWQYDPDEYAFAWVFHSRNHKIEISSGKDPVEIVSDLPAAMSVLASDHTLSKAWDIPVSHQPGIFEGAPDVYSGEWKPLIVWYHGLKTDSAGGTYPFGSADCIDRAGNIISDVPHSLKLQGFKNIYEARWKRYLNWRISAKPVRVNIIPDKAFLRNFQFSKTVRFGAVNYLVAQARGNINRLGPDVWELLLYVK
jgi:hypothetical protein